LIFHDCGELTDAMVEAFNELDPAVLSLGCSRTLWEDARLVSKRTVLFGNLPSKQFYSDKDMPLELVSEMSVTLVESNCSALLITRRMAASLPGATRI